MDQEDFIAEYLAARMLAALSWLDDWAPPPLVVWLCIGGALAACSPVVQKRADDALVVGTYERQLDQCREKGKASGSYAVYEACARAVDRTLCATKGLMCTDGGEP